MSHNVSHAPREPVSPRKPASNSGISYFAKFLGGIGKGDLSPIPEWMKFIVIWLFMKLPPLLSFIKDALHSPYLLANTLMTICTGVGIVGILFVSGSPQLINRIASGEDTATILAIVTCTALLTGSLATYVFATLREQKKFDVLVDKKVNLIIRQLNNVSSQLHGERKSAPARDLVLKAEMIDPAARETIVDFGDGSFRV